MKTIFIMLVLFVIVLVLWQWNKPSPQYKESDHYSQNHFYNLNHENANKSFYDLLKWKFATHATPWPEKVDDNATPDLMTMLDKEQLRVTFINHATVLLQWQNLNVLTDPVFLNSIGPQYLDWIKRHRAPGVPLDKLPPIDYILLSHNHYDHLDRPSLEKIIARDKSKLLVPLGVGQYIPANGKQNYQALDWWESHQNNAKKLSITLVPALHWSKRSLFDTNKSLWGGFVIEKDGMVVYFAGDTGYSEHFKRIAQKFPKIDLALLPIGAYEPRDFMKKMHMNPPDAVQAAEDLNAAHVLGIHFGTFRLTNEGIDDPIIDLNKSLAKRAFKKPFIAPKNGQSFYYKAS